MDFDEIFAIIRIVLFGVIALVALVYSLPIIFIRRFHHRNNILTVNICSVTILCCLYWFIFYIMFYLNPYDTFLFMLNACVFVFIIPPILTLQVPLSFVTISINRYFCVVHYQKAFFKTKKWIAVCILGQWIFGVVCMLPILSGIQLYCGSPQWVETYKMIFLVIVPGIIFTITNSLIFINVHSSSRRIQPNTLSVSENQSNLTSNQVKISRRDIHLLRHMIIMLSIFVIGWAPLYVLLAIQNQFLINPVLSASFTIWCQLALLFDIIDLYLYNHEVRSYLKTFFCRCF